MPSRRGLHHQQRPPRSRADGQSIMPGRRADEWPFVSRMKRRDDE